MALIEMDFALGNGGGIKSDTFHVTSAGETITVDTGLGSSLTKFAFFGITNHADVLLGEKEYTFCMWESTQSSTYGSATTLSTSVAGGMMLQVGSTATGDGRAAKIMDVTNGVITITSDTAGFMNGCDFTWIAE